MNAAEANIQLASDAWPPFTNEVGKARLAIEIVHLALARSGYVPETTILDTWTIPSDLKSDKYHGCGAIWKSVEREKYLLFSKPYLESRLHLVGKKGSDVAAQIYLLYRVSLSHSLMHCLFNSKKGTTR